MTNWFTVLLVSGASTFATVAAHPVPEGPFWLTYPGGEGPGKGKHILLIAAEQEYRSEQALPMLARILSRSHGFDCTVLFSVNDNGLVDPTRKIRWEQEGIVHHVPGLEHLRKADLMILFSRLLTLPDDEIAHIIEYLDSGKPIIGIRTANHGFLENFPYQRDGKPVHFGRDILGGTFLNHHGNWHADSTRGIIVEENQDHPVLIGVDDIWGPSDVYRTYREGESLSDECTPLVYGQPLLGRSHDDDVNPKKIPLPVAWVKPWRTNSGKEARVFHTTMGSARDFQSAGLRRLTINAVYWCLGMEDQISPDRSVDIIGAYEPLESGFHYEKIGVVPRKAEDYR